jgi:hypothetical protein
MAMEAWLITPSSRAINAATLTRAKSPASRSRAFR